MNRQLRLPELPECLSVDDVSAYLGVSRSTVYEAIHAGQLRVARIRRRIVVPKKSLIDLLASNDPDALGGDETKEK